MGKEQPRVVIIGAGLSAIALAIRLKKDLGYENFTMYERADESGGTWRANTYPGCACDVPSHWYSLSTELNPFWTEKFSSQPEIKSYWEGIFAKHKLASHAVFSTTFKSAVWDEDNSLWHINFYSTKNPSETFSVDAEMLISAAGGLTNPNFQEQSLHGSKTFGGKMFHSAEWDHSVSLAGKKVALIGNGCSGAQILPVISEDETMQLTNFSRTPSWMVPRGQYSYSDRTKWIFANVPLAMKAYRYSLVTLGDLRWLGWLDKYSWMRKGVEKKVLERMRAIAPKEYHEQLTPNYPLGCKRVIMDPGYYKALNRPNVKLVTSKIEEITKTGIRTADGTHHDFDVIILATGFDTTTKSVALDITAYGKKIEQVWNSKGGPQAYLGTSLAGFPNFASLLGPNVASGHYSVVGSSEMQISMIIDLVRPLLKKSVKSLEVKEEAENEYNKEIQGRLNESVFAKCDSWYRFGDGKIIGVRPGFYVEYWKRTRRVDYSKYIQKGGWSNLARDQADFDSTMKFAGVGMACLFSLAAGISYFRF